VSEIEFDPVDQITVGAVGEPGERTFMIQARRGVDTTTLVLEKAQVVALARETFELLSRVGFPERSETQEAEELDETHEPMWRVGTIAIAYEEERDLIMVECRELVPEEEEMGERARFWVTRSQFVGLGRRGLEVAAQGRPTCPYCWQPMDPSGHFCVATNGHGRGRDEV
jgi:uncharacterized repeat protein (TIGR03847 family)